MTRGVIGTRCDYHYDPESGCDGVYDQSGRCDQCGKPSIFEDYDPDSPLAANVVSAPRSGANQKDVDVR